MTMTLDHNCLFIASRYFNDIDDYINATKVCKEYRGIMDEYRYNPIPFNNKNERNLFSNIEVYHFYNMNTEVENEIILNDPNIKKRVQHEEPYHEDWLEYYRRLQTQVKKNQTN